MQRAHALRFIRRAQVLSQEPERDQGGPQRGGRLGRLGQAPLALTRPPARPPPRRGRRRRAAAAPGPAGAAGGAGAAGVRAGRRAQGGAAMARQGRPRAALPSTRASLNAGHPGAASRGAAALPARAPPISPTPLCLPLQVEEQRRAYGMPPVERAPAAAAPAPGGFLGAVRRDLGGCWRLLASSWLNVLLLAAPLGLASSLLGWGAAASFGLVGRACRCRQRVPAAAGCRGAGGQQAGGAQPLCLRGRLQPGGQCRPLLSCAVLPPAHPLQNFLALLPLALLLGEVGGARCQRRRRVPPALAAVARPRSALKRPPAEHAESRPHPTTHVPTFTKQKSLMASPFHQHHIHQPHHHHHPPAGD
jgi:hypothetical protein